MRESVAHPNRRADCQRVLIEVEGPVDLERHVGSHDAEHFPLVVGPHSATGITPLGKLHSGTPRIWRRVGSVGSGCSSGSFDSIEPVTFLSLLSANTVAASAANAVRRLPVCSIGLMASENGSTVSNALPASTVWHRHR